MGFNCKSNILTENDKVHNPAPQLGQAGELQKLIMSPLTSLGIGLHRSGCRSKNSAGLITPGAKRCFCSLLPLHYA